MCKIDNSLIYYGGIYDTVIDFGAHENLFLRFSVQKILLNEFSCKEKLPIKHLASARGGLFFGKFF